MTDQHSYEVSLTWTGNLGAGTNGYRAYSRAHEVTAPGRPPLLGSSDPHFRGEPDRWNPEQLLVAALAQCHLLWYLHLCADAGVVVTAYEDRPEGTVVLDDFEGGWFTEVMLNPQVTVADESMIEKAQALHEQAHRRCFLANSVNFPVRSQPVAVAAR